MRPPSRTTIALDADSVETVMKRFLAVDVDRLCSSFDSISFSRNESESTKSVRSNS